MFGIQKEESGPGHDPGATLFAQAQAGNSESLNKLMQRHEGLVYLVVQRQWLFTLPYKEALQAGRRGLWRAILGYDPGRGVTFATYAYKAIMRYVWSIVKAEQRRLRREVAVGILVVYYYQTGSDPAWLRDQQEIGEATSCRRPAGVGGTLAQTVRMGHHSLLRLEGESATELASDWRTTR